MPMCNDCFKAHKEGGWYIGDDETAERVPVEKCDVHPVLTNWRVARTMRSLKYWSLCGEAYEHPNARGVRLCLSFGRVHRRTAEAILFDYEKPFIDLLIKSGYIEQEKNFDGVARVLKILPAHDDYLKGILTAKQYEAFKEELRQLALKEYTKGRKKSGKGGRNGKSTG